MTSPLNLLFEKLSSDAYSPDYVREVREYAINLESRGLPVIFSTIDLAIQIGVPPKFLYNIINNQSEFYSSYKIRKKSGGVRWILAPSDELKYIQNWIKFNILDKIPIHANATGFVTNKSIFNNAQMHAEKSLVLNLDLYRFFDTINSRRVFGLFHSLGYSSNLSYDIGKLLCADPPKKYWEELKAENILSLPSKISRLVLPQGAPTSPVITNIICSTLDKRLSALAMKLNCTYSRYADDLTFSGERKDVPSLKLIKKIISEEGFHVNSGKTKWFSKNKRQFVTGLVVNNGVKVPKATKREVNSHLYYCLKYGPENHLQFLARKGVTLKSNYKHWLLGKISFIKSIEPKTAEAMFEKFSLIDWGI